MTVWIGAPLSPAEVDVAWSDKPGKVLDVEGVDQPPSQLIGDAITEACVRLFRFHNFAVAGPDLWRQGREMFDNVCPDTVPAP